MWRVTHLQDYANRYVSWGTYFESLIKRAAYDELFTYSHGSTLNDCYYANCDFCNSHKMQRCNYGIESNKFDLLLSWPNINGCCS